MIPVEFSKSSHEFEDTHGFPKPAPNDKIVVYCKAGVRSASAAGFLAQQGYRDVSNYPGYMDWFGHGY
jgi:rhodanese-related sulfurtransferase